MKYIEKPILVTGVNHTGTTMVVEVLKRLGVFMGDHGVDIPSNNEWTPYLKVNLEIMNRWNPRLSWRALDYPSIEEIEKEYVRIPIPEPPILKRRWGIKLPSICILLPAYLKRFPKAWLIYCTRNKEDLIESLLRRDGLDREHWEKFIEVMDERFKMVAKKYHQIQYEEFCYHPIKETKKMCQYLQLEYKPEIEGWLKEFITTDKINKGR